VTTNHQFSEANLGDAAIGAVIELPEAARPATAPAVADIADFWGCTGSAAFREFIAPAGNTVSN
jgi:hypothetical protein